MSFETYSTLVGIAILGFALGYAIRVFGDSTR
jgi:uncharacterized membrane protein (Fun14 family)